MSHSQTAEEDLLERIVRLIEVLGYDGMETLDHKWVRSVLVSGGTERHNFMVWVVSQFCSTDAADLQMAPVQTHSQRILQSLSSMGVCKPGDADLIEGTAPPFNQLKFWRACLEKIGQLRQASNLRSRRQDSFTSDMLLDHLAHSSYLNQILKDSGANVIPGDLRGKYRASYKYIKSIPLSEVLQESEEHLSESQERYKAVDKKWKTSSPVCANGDDQNGEQQQNLCSTISGLNKQQDLFQGVYTSYIAPWTTSAPQLELPNTGPLVQEATAKLLNLTKVLKSMEEVSQRCEELAEQEKQMTRHVNHPPTIMSTLQSIVTLESNAKSATGMKI